MVNKKGQENTNLAVVVGIVLLVILLVLVVYSLVTGNNVFAGVISTFTGSGSNVATVVQACQLACSSNSQTDYCSTSREVKFGFEGNTDKGTPANFEKATKVSLTCNELQIARITKKSGGDFNVSMSACGSFSC